MKKRNAVQCTTCEGSGDRPGVPGANGLALAGSCTDCDGSGWR